MRHDEGFQQEKLPNQSTPKIVTCCRLLTRHSYFSRDFSCKSYTETESVILTTIDGMFVVILLSCLDVVISFLVFFPESKS